MEGLPARVDLGFFPTPLEDLRRLSRELGGPRVLMKRDDLTGLAFGGNKTRKLEFLLGEALAEDCDSLVTGGAAQSNHCRQTAAAAAMCGLDCHLALGGTAPEFSEGNLLLDELLGATVHWTGELRKGERIADIAAALRDEGGRPYVLPYGGSNSTGVLGFVEAVRELYEQLDAIACVPTHVVFASSSAGTQAGLELGKRMLGREITLLGIGVDKDDEMESPVAPRAAQLANETAARLELGIRVGADEPIVRGEFMGEGYGIVGDPEREAIALTARNEGILLDPVYTGRAMAGLIGLIRRGELDSKDTVVFWHTGGTPALFSYAREIGPRRAPDGR